ncbi:phospholipase A2 inhibitor gamma subunit B-like [Spea bombifrons]|uniref:phospholipase A2 inhibitor gamma subunit B-like n=1 Tax=Spea bombifrons TaxID=233779 RepID=UPI00234918B4|nr:phospholipase A2 inhibitor gamma subunit B-like [Spea bombifrons]
MAISENYTVENLSFPSKLMGCAEEELCNKIIKFNTDHEMDIHAYAKCCKGNLCNENIPYSFPPKCKLNGKYCESCFAKNTKGECVSSKKIECRGNQHKCHSYAGTVERPDLSVMDYSVKGCMSDLGCIMKFGSLIGVKQLEERVFKCSEALD